MNCIFFDADGTETMTCLLAARDVQYDENFLYYKPRLHQNDESGNLS